MEIKQYHCSCRAARLRAVQVLRSPSAGCSCEDEEVTKSMKQMLEMMRKKKKIYFWFLKKNPCKTYALMMGTC